MSPGCLEEDGVLKNKIKVKLFTLTLGVSILSFTPYMYKVKLWF